MVTGHQGSNSGSTTITPSSSPVSREMLTLQHAWNLKTRRFMTSCIMICLNLELWHQEHTQFLAVIYNWDELDEYTGHA